MYGMFLYGQYEDLTPPEPTIVEKTVYVGGGYQQPSMSKIPTVRVRLLRKEEEKFNIVVKSIEEF